AVFVEVPRRSVLWRESHRLHVASCVRELGREDRAVAGELMIVAELFLDRELEAIAGLQFRAEVDLAAEDLRQGKGQVDCLAGGVERGDQRGMFAVDLS